MRSFPPDVRYEKGVAFSPNRILQYMSKLALPEWDMVTASVSKCDDSLLQKCQRFVDIHGFYLRFTFRQRFPKPLWPSQVHEVEFRSDIFRVGLYTRVGFDMDGKDAVRTWWSLIEGMLTNNPICFALSTKQTKLSPVVGHVVTVITWMQGSLCFCHVTVHCAKTHPYGRGWVLLCLKHNEHGRNVLKVHLKRTRSVFNTTLALG